MTRGSRWSLLVLVAACGPRADPEVDASSSGAGTTIVVDTGVATTSTTGDDDTSTSTSTTTCGVPPEPTPELETCDAVRTPEASLGVDGISPAYSEAQLPCTVDTIAASPDGADVVLELTCTVPERGATPVRIGISSDSVPPVPVLPGDDVLVGYAGGGLFDEILLTLRRADQSLVLVWIDAGWLPTVDEPSIPSASFLDPMIVGYAREHCGYECDPDTGCGGFIENPCRCIRRLAIDVRVGDAMQRLVDGTRGSVDGFDVHVVHAAIQTAEDGGWCAATDVFPRVRFLAVAKQ